ncbi:hypothetical protein BaRGS_00038715, partial [Batillaria attramentaria]
MISIAERIFGYRNCRRNVVKLYDGSNLTAHPLVEICDQGGDRLRDYVWMFEVRPLKVLFQKLGSHRPASFKLLFSFHELSTIAPLPLPGRRWNCSVPRWPEFKPHFFPCNLENDCLNNEDEAECSYTGHCGVGKISIADRERGGYLVSLNTPREWSDVMQLLHRKMSATIGPDRDVTAVLIGLRTAPRSATFMYRGEMVWADSTLALYSEHVRPKTRSLAMCGRRHHHFFGLHGDATRAELDPSICDSSHIGGILCELEQNGATPQVNHHSASRIHFSADPAHQRDVSSGLVVCPKGHVTHGFLACDVRCSCWAEAYNGDVSTWGIPTRRACPAPMTSLPPSFSCRNGLQRVPYSLVCDHRQDCGDASDEDFCQFAPCGADTPVQCGLSKQCVKSDAVCDRQTQCLDGSDEDLCEEVNPTEITVDKTPPPAIVHFDPRIREDSQFI